MSKKMFIDASQKDETRMAIVEDDRLIEYESEFLKLKPTKGNIYLAKIIRVEPSLQAAFVDYGAQRHGFLAYNEIHPDYFKIPTSDKEKILAEEHRNSSRYSEDSTEEDDIDINQNKYIESDSINAIGKKSFLDRVIDFFNYKPSDDKELFEEVELKKPKIKKNKFSKPNIYSIHRKYSIQEVIKRNQVILIQVVKEERGNKGAAVTTRLSLAGRYCVLMPNTNRGGGISRKIFDIVLRKKLKEILNSLNIKKGMGVIIRTAGQEVKKTDISRDYKALLKVWNQITATTIKSTAPKLIHEEGNLLKRSIRDYFDSNIKEVIVNDKEVLKKAKEIMKSFIPNYLKLINIDNEGKNGSLFALNNLENQINVINKQNVKLKSGGYLVINQTEALVAIDVNSGRYTKQRNIEDTALKTNLEAAEEIARQIKLRDLAGLIVIDFIDMLERSNNFKVERKMKDSIKRDRARVQCGKISSFGLLEMSRQRLKQVINSATSNICSTCNGVGFVNSIEFSAMQILRVCEEKLINSKNSFFQILANKKIVEYIKKDKSEFLKMLKVKYKKKIHLIEFPLFSSSDSSLFCDNEVIYNNCNDETKILKAQEFLEDYKSQKKDIKEENKKKNYKIDNTKKNKGVEDNIIKTEKRSSETKASLPKKRASYRAKALDFNNKNIGNLETKNKKVKKVESLSNVSSKGMEKIQNTSKKHGWWNQ